MSYNDSLPLFMKLFIGFAVSAFVFVMVMGVYESICRRKCLEFGYPSVNLSFFTPYCIKRVDQSDVVAKLSDLEAAQNGGRICPIK